jgi:hypothetical protein
VEQVHRAAQARNRLSVVVHLLFGDHDSKMTALHDQRTPGGGSLLEEIWLNKDVARLVPSRFDRKQARDMLC